MFNVLLKQWRNTLKYKNIKENDINDMFDNFLFIMDNLNNDILKTFNSFPERWLIFNANKIVYKGSAVPQIDTKNIDAVDQFLQQHCT